MGKKTYKKYKNTQKYINRRWEAKIRYVKNTEKKNKPTPMNSKNLK